MVCCVKTALSRLNRHPLIMTVDGNRSIPNEERGIELMNDWEFNDGYSSIIVRGRKGQDLVNDTSTSILLSDQEGAVDYDLFLTSSKQICVSLAIQIGNTP